MIVIVCLGGSINIPLKQDTIYELTSSCDVECFDGNHKNIFQKLSQINLLTKDTLLIINSFENFEKLKNDFEIVSILLYDYSGGLASIFYSKEYLFDICLDCVGKTFATIKEKNIPEYL